MRALTWLKRRGEADSLDRAVTKYEARIRSGSPSLEGFWAGLGSRQAPSILAALVKLDLKRRFEAGERPRVLEYLQAFPVLAEDPDRVISLVYEEFCFLQEAGENPDSRAFCEAYGPWRDSLRSQLDYHRELSRAVGAEAAPVNYPALGDRFDKYHLTSILGEGGVARVYLAIEDVLDRQVAIKVSASFGQEPSILAKLDHRNIVPILTVAESESGLRGICMPYRPGITLEDLIKRIGRGTPPRSARAISDALRPRDPQIEFPPDDQRVGWADFPIGQKFPEAVAWIGLALANALSYLHEKGVFHRDIKPANILLAYKEGPQLLDFNLAQDPNNRHSATAAQKGGTLPYMAPEQLKAFIDPSAWESVQEAADLYSLGLVLRELVTGRPPELPTSRGSLAREIQSLIDRRLAPAESISEINPEVPPALESIIDKCLAFRPEDRYASANDLAGDLRLFLVRKPLEIAPNTSKIELVANWVYRNRVTLVTAIIACVVLLFVARFLPGRVPGDADIERAERHYESPNLATVELARKEFDELHRQRPDTARSSLGLALTLLKLKSSDRDGINRLVLEAQGKDDAREAFEDHVAKEPDSPLLHLNLGLVLTRKGSSDQARAELEKCLKLDPTRIAAFPALAALDVRNNHYRDAVDHMEKAILLCQQEEFNARVSYDLRVYLLKYLVEMINQNLEGPAGIADRAVASSSCQRLGDHLRELADEWKSLSTPGEQKEHPLGVFWSRIRMIRPRQSSLSMKPPHDSRRPGR
jgi:serine/threonine protein kinase